MITDHSPYISIVLPTYNRGEQIRASINSVLAQTHQKFELLVVDDCSVDNTEEIIASYKDERIHYYRNPQNKGACASRNNGIANAAYELITFLDSDDTWRPNYLEAHIANLVKLDMPMGEFGLQFCQYYFHENGTSAFKPGRELNLATPESALKTLLLRNYITTQTLVTTKTVLNSVGGFDNELGAFQDWDLAIRIVAKYRVVYLQQPLVDVYLSGDSITLNHPKRYKALMHLVKKHRAAGLLDNETFYTLTYNIVRYAQIHKLKADKNYGFKTLLGLKPFDMRTYYYLLKKVIK